MTCVLAFLYVVGFGLIMGGAVAGWKAAGARLAELNAIRRTVLGNVEAYYSRPSDYLALMGEPGYQAASAEYETAGRKITDKNAADLKAAGFGEETAGAFETWVPKAIDRELAVLDVARGALKGPGLAALAGGFLSTVASVWSLYL
ncbi:hypothetical protein AAEX63_15655 [Luteococcus sp. H138]|uniref:hypothetical protein n=1 Tax=unclassified Luteococcus TaxID=2639923 RepID=UPI00313DDBA7